MKVYKIKVNGKSYRVELEAIDEVATDAQPKKEEVAKTPQKGIISTGGCVGQEVPSPIQGTVIKVLVNVGDKVKKGTPLFIVEAMKLENEVVSPVEGEVSEICVSKGQAVASKEVLARVK